MKLLMLTWEFPPLITGGLGMACYGMARALLFRNIGIELVLPVGKGVFFRLREAKDADAPPAAFANAVTRSRLRNAATIFDIARQVEAYAGAYEAGGFRMWRTKETRAIVETPPVPEVSAPGPSLQHPILKCLQGDGDLFRAVREYSLEAADLSRSMSFDVIHAHDWLTWPAAVLIKHASGKPLVAHVHATEFDRAAGTGNEWIHKVEYLGLKEADRIIAVSAYTAGLVVERYAVPRQITRVVHNAYTLSATGERRPRLFAGPTILFLGRITLQKGPDYFLEVAARVLRHAPEAHFIMAGTGDMAREMMHRAAALELGTRFLFAGFLSRAEVEEVLSSTDIFVLPSVSEPFGIAPLEAMSYGAAAIISRQAGVAEVIENAVKVDFWDVDRMADAILELLGDPARLSTLATKGMEEVAKIQWDAAAQRIMDVLREVVED
jgi:glycogen synthase